MPAASRPANIEQTKDNVQMGTPFVSFSRTLSNGSQTAYRDLGIIQDAEVAKTIQLASLRNPQSGISTLARQDVREFDAQLDISLSEISAENLRLFLASEDLDAVTANGAEAVTAEIFNATDDPEDFIELANVRIDPTAGNITVEAGQVTDEAVGTGDGAVTTFDLDYKVFAETDVTAFTVAGVDRTADIQAGAPTGTEIQIESGTGTTSGNITFGTAPTGAIVATYKPTFTIAAGTTVGDTYTIDGKGGRIRINQLGATKAAAGAFLDYQPFDIDYLYERLAHSIINPFTQFTFPGKARVELLTDIGINIIWPIPSVSLRITDDAFAFSREDYLTGNLSMILNDTGGDAPYGSAQVYSETEAAS